MARPEAGLWDHLRGLLPAGIHYSRIESETCPGFPDVHYTLEGISGTIELKSTDRRTAQYPFCHPHGLRKSQVDWIMEELPAKGIVYLCLEVGKEIFLLQADLYAEVLGCMTLDDIRRVAELTWKRGKVDQATKDALAAVLADPLVNKA